MKCSDVNELKWTCPELGVKVAKKLKGMDCVQVADYLSFTSRFAWLASNRSSSERRGLICALKRFTSYSPFATRQALLTTTLMAKDHSVLLEAAKALREMGPQTTSAVVLALRACLEDKNADVRRIAARTLGEIGPAAKDAVSALAVMLDDDDDEVCETAADAIWYIDPVFKGAVPMLIERLKNWNHHIRLRAAESLGKIGHDAKEALSDLKDIADDKDEHPDVRKTAANALKKIER